MKRVPLLLTLGCLLLLACAPSARTGEKPNPILELAKEKVSDPKKPFTMVVILTAKEGQGKKLEEAFKPAIEASRKEKGCIPYDLNRDLENATTYSVYERWQSLAALEHHMQTPHFKTLVGKVGEILAGPPEARFFAIAE